MAPIVCTGFPWLARSSRRLKSFLAIRLEGYTCCKVPLLLTTSSGLYGRLMPLYLGLAHQSLTCCTCWLKISSSAAPAFCDSGSSWNASVGCVADIGGSTGDSVLAIRAAEYDIDWPTRGVLAGLYRHRRCCRNARVAVRNMADIGEDVDRGYLSIRDVCVPRRMGYLRRQNHGLSARG